MEDWELKAREQIRHLAARYNAFGDSGRFENVMALFAEDAVVEVVGHQTYRGHAEIRRPAASHDILERARCNSNASEVVCLKHTPHCAVRFALIRSSRADLCAAESFRVTSSPVPKNISFGVCPWNAECGITSLWAVT